MNKEPLRSEEIIACMVAALVACILAANRVGGDSSFGWVGAYVYWIPRIAMETALYFMVLVLVEKSLSDRLSPKLTFALAWLVSLVPFTLAVTTFDLILGLPELGFNAVDGSADTGLSAFLKELIYLSDNHLALCALLMMPRYLTRRLPEHETSETNTSSGADQKKDTFMDAIDPPLQGRIVWIEAQEHYVKIKTEHESRMVLHRFADAIRELPASTGMQVHRSHWVCFSDIKALKREGQRLRLLLSSGDYVPVSRSYRQQLEEKFQTLNGRTNPQ